MDIQEEESKEEQIKYQFDIPQVINLLKDVLSGINQKIKDATKILKVFTKQEECLAPLLYLMANSPEIQLRQISAVLLKRNIMILFDEMQDVNKKEEIKKLLLDRYFQEPSKPVRESIGRVISLIMNTAFIKEHGWKQLTEEIDRRTDKNSQLKDREIGLALISFLVELTSNEINNHYEKYLQFFLANLRDPERIIRMQTLKTLMYLFENFDRTQLKTVDTFKNILPTIIQVIDECVQLNEEDLVHLCFEVFSLVAESKTKFLNEELIRVVSYIFSNSIIFNKNLSLSLKEAGLDIISTLAYHHRAVLTADLKILNQILVSLVNMASQPFSKGPMEEDGETLQDIALWLIETLTLRLPKKHVYKTLINEINKLIHSNDENYMNAGFLILAGICEGCATLMKKDLEKVLLNDFIAFGISQNSAKVRGAAITALGYLSEFLIPDVVDFHQIIIPILLKGFNEEDSKVAEKSVFSMDIFCENMEKEIIPYLSTIMPSLANLTVNPKATNFMKKMAIMSIGSCVTSAQQEFKPYMNECVQFLSQIIMAKNDTEFLTVQSAAIQSLGKIFMIFYFEEAELYTNYIMPCMEHIYNTMVNIDDSEIREASLSFFYLLASTMGEDFSAILDKITDFTFKIAESEKGVSYVDNGDEFSLDTDSDDESSMDHKNATDMKVHMNFLDEKAAAIHAIGEFAQACPIQFKPHFEKAITLLQVTYNYFYENIRIQSVICLKNIAEGLVKSIYNGNLPKYERGKLGLKFPKEIHDFLFEVVYNRYMELMQDDESIEVKATCLESLCQLVSSLGPAFIEYHYKETIKYLRKRLRRHVDGFKKSYLGYKSVVHHDNDVDEDADSGDGSDDDEDNEDRIMMFEYVTDLIPALSKAMGNEFKTHFVKMYTPLIVCTQKNVDIDEKIQVLGTFAQTFKHMPVLIELYQDKFIRLFEEMLQEKDDGLNRNVAFCCGVCCLKNPNAMIIHFPRILKILSKVYEESSLLEAKENALAALARMIMASPDNVPVEECLKKILASTPFKGDLEEEKTIVKLLIFLCQKSETLIAKYLEPAMMLILDAIIYSHKYKVSEKVLDSSAKIIKAICLNNNTIKERVEIQVLNLPARNKKRVVDLLK